MNFGVYQRQVPVLHGSDGLRFTDHTTVVLPGRVPSCEQVQIEVLFLQHRIRLDLFPNWWAYRMRSFRARADAVLEFERRPRAITDRDNRDFTDLFAEALQLRDLLRARW